MLHVFLWAVFLVWGALGFVLFAFLLATLAGATTRMIADRRGHAGTIWCPIFRRQYDVVGTPPSFAGRPFDDVKRCERYGRNRVLCRKSCLKVQELVAAAGTN
jgi:hypothetical protein